MWIHVLGAAQEIAQAAGGNTPSGGGSAAQGGGNPQYVQYLLAVLGPAGIIGSIVALLRFKTDSSSQVFTQYQGVTAEWKATAEDRKQEIAEKEVEIAELKLEIKTKDADHSRKTREFEDEIRRLNALLHPPASPAP